MRIRTSSVPLLTSCAAMTLVMACAPDNAQELREIRPTTLGLLGGAYHPNGMMVVGGTLGFAKNLSPRAVTDSEKDQDLDVDERDFKLKKSGSLNGFLHYYPMASSAFFVGGALEYQRIEFEYQERTTNYTDSAKSFAKVNFESSGLWAGLPLGWAWIWGNGLTLILDFGPRFRLSQSKHYNDSGLDQAVNISRRDDFVDDVDRSFSFGGSGLIGYSF